MATQLAQDAEDADDAEETLEAKEAEIAAEAALRVKVDENASLNSSATSTV